MSFDLVLDQPKPTCSSQLPETYHPGQILSGTLTYNLSKQRTLNSITLTLRGKLEGNYVEIRTNSSLALTQGPRRPMKEVIRLFEDTRMLFNGPYDVPAQKFEWPFEFHIPPFVEHRRSDEKGRSKGFINDGWGELPPSFDWIDRTMIHDASIKIRYKLVASVQSGGLFGNEEREWPITIRRVSILPVPGLRSQPAEFGSGVSWKSHKLRVEGEKLGMRQRLKSVVSDDPALKMPGINFRAWVHMPRCFSATQKFDVGFGILYNKVEENDPEKPILLLENVRLILKSRTQMTIKRGEFVGMTITGDRKCEGWQVVADHMVKFGVGKDQILPLDGESVHVGEMCVGDWKNREGAVLLGNFVTWTVKYGYWLAVEASVRHKDTGKVFTLDTGFSVELRDTYAPELSGKAGRANGNEDELPQYGDDVRPPDAMEDFDEEEQEEEVEGTRESSSRGEKNRLRSY